MSKPQVLSAVRLGLVVAPLTSLAQPIFAGRSKEASVTLEIRGMV